jgi:hypothetical protein
VIIYDEENEVPEMYFCLEGVVHIGYFARGKQGGVTEFKGVKKFSQKFILCDHYVVNNMRSEFVFKCIQSVKCFALTKKFLLKNIFPNYPDIAMEIKGNASRRYNEYLRKPINAEFNKDMILRNKKSTYKQMYFQEKSSDLKKLFQRASAEKDTKVANLYENDGINPY